MRDQVEKANLSRLAGIKGPPTIYNAIDLNVSDASEEKRLKGSCLAPDVLELKKSAQVSLTISFYSFKVMLIKNLPEYNLVNGNVGTVVDFSDKGMPIVKYHSQQPAYKPL